MSSPSHERLKKIAFGFTSAIWICGVVSLVFLLFSLLKRDSFDNKQNFNEALNLNRLSENTHTLLEDSLPEQARRVVPARSAEPNAESKSTFHLEFDSKSSFLQYFEDQYSVNELLARYDEALIKSGRTESPAKILVETKTKHAKSGKFADNFKVSLNFSIKPVPQ